MSYKKGDNVQVFVTGEAAANEKDVYIFPEDASIPCQVTGLNGDGTFSVRGTDHQGKSVEIESVSIGAPDGEGFYVNDQFVLLILKSRQSKKHLADD